MTNQEKIEFVDALMGLYGGWYEMSHAVPFDERGYELERQTLAARRHDTREDIRNYWKPAFYDAMMRVKPCSALTAS